MSEENRLYKYKYGNDMYLGELDNKEYYYRNSVPTFYDGKKREILIFESKKEAINIIYEILKASLLYGTLDNLGYNVDIKYLNDTIINYIGKLRNIGEGDAIISIEKRGLEAMTIIDTVIYKENKIKKITLNQKSIEILFQLFFKHRFNE